MYLAKYICPLNESHTFSNNHPVIFHCFVRWLFFKTVTCFFFFTTDWFHARQHFMLLTVPQVRIPNHYYIFFVLLNCRSCKLIAKFISDKPNKTNRNEFPFNSFSLLIDRIECERITQILSAENRFAACQSMSNIIIINFLDHSVELMRSRSVHVIHPQKDTQYIYF